jgi:hypothetical protein
VIPFPVSLGFGRGSVWAGRAITLLSLSLVALRLVLRRPRAGNKLSAKIRHPRIGNKLSAEIESIHEVVRRVLITPFLPSLTISHPELFKFCKLIGLKSVGDEFRLLTVFPIVICTFALAEGQKKINRCTTK